MPNKSTILIVDDMIVNLKLLNKVLTANGYVVREATNGEEALESVLEKKPDLILLDVCMPGMDGYQVCKFLKSSPQMADIPVIFTSSLEEIEDKVHGFEVGGVDYLTKPFFPKEILARVSTHLELRKSRENIEKYRTIVESSSDYIMRYDKECRHTFGNSATLNFSGLSLAEYTGKTHRELGYPDHLCTLWEENIQKVFATGEIRKVEFDIDLPTGKISLELKLSPEYDSDGKVNSVIGISREITDRKRVEEVQAFLLHSGFVDSSENFFENLAKFLAEKLGMDFVCIDKLSGDLLSAQTVAVYFDGHFEDNIEYTLHDTPCGVVAGKIICTYPSGVRHLFPNDQVLQEMNAESYLGVTLWGSHGKPIGLIAVIGRKPLTNKHLSETILKLVAIRAAWELERTESEKKLKSSEEKFRNLVWDMSVGVLLQGSQAEMLMSNPKALELLGLTEDQLLGKTSFDPDWNVIHEDGSPFPGTTHPVPLAIATGKAVHSVVMGVYRPTIGDRIWLLVDAIPQLNSDGSVFQVVCTFIDITNSKKTEDKLRASEERYSLLIQNFEAGIVVHAPDTSIIMNNSKASELLGLTDDQMKGKTAIDPEWKFIDETNMPMPFEAYPVNRILSEKKSIRNQILGIRQPSKKDTVWVIVNGVLVVDVKGEISEIVISFIDISKTKNAETALIAAKEKAEAASLAKSIFLANMSHEIKTPLNAILGFSSLMKDKNNLTQDTRKKAEIINQSGQHLLNMINDILSMAKIEAGRIRLEPSSFDLYTSVKEVMDMMRHWSDEKKLELLLDYATIVPRVIVSDALKLKQILINLLNNAIKFTEQGRIFLHLNCSPHQESGKLNLLIQIEDTGIGIAPKNQKRIFEPFVQVEDINFQKGTGLGLPICKKYIELMGGKISVNSQLGKGSLFSIELPVGFNMESHPELERQITVQDIDLFKNKTLLSPDLLNILSMESKSELKDAILNLDTELIGKLLDKIYVTNPTLGKVLKELAGEFKFTTILNLLG